MWVLLQTIYIETIEYYAAKKRSLLYFLLYRGQFFQTFAVQTNAEWASYPSPTTATTSATMTDKRIICVSQQQAPFHKLNANETVQTVPLTSRNTSGINSSTKKSDSSSSISTL